MVSKEELKTWIESVVRTKLTEECAKDEQMAHLAIAMEKGHPQDALPTYVLSVLCALAEYEDFYSLPERLEDMNEPQLGEHLGRQLRFIQGSETPDTIGSMLVIFAENNITQYGGTIDPEGAPDALRELADRIERRETVKRGEG